jgi:hypothetical protein
MTYLIRKSAKTTPKPRQNHLRMDRELPHEMKHMVDDDDGHDPEWKGQVTHVILAVREPAPSKGGHPKAGSSQGRL